MRFSQFRRAIESAAQLDVLEGLPHPAVEPHAFARESAANAERDILGSRFYQESHPLDAEDHAAIRTVLAERRTFVRRYPDLRFWLTVRSLCGGFHADFAIEFRHDGRVGAALVCFGCREIKTLIQGRHCITICCPTPKPS
jgi:hypothetical protein